MKPSARAPAGVTTPAAGVIDDETREDPGGDAQAGGLAVVHGLDADPRQRTGGGRDLGHRERLRRLHAAGQGAAGVEPEPADPQQAHADQRHDQVVRVHGRARIAAPRAQVESSDQAADARGDVDHGAAGEVDRPQLEQEALGAGADDHTQWHSGL